MARRLAILMTLALTALLVAAPLNPPTFHLMQIEQVIAGINDDTTAQAVQLRMRDAGQGQLAGARLTAFDANGGNPVVIIDFDAAVEVDALGSTVLVATPSFLQQISPPMDADFLMQALLPESSINAGSLVFSNDAGNQVYWRLCWGGDAYQGTTTGSNVNDDDGEFAPAFAGPLAAADLRSIAFPGKATSLSTTNLADYTLSTTPSIFTNNNGQQAAVVGRIDPCTADCGDGDGVVDINDLLILLRQMISPPPYPCDIWPPSGDGQVDTPDLVFLLDSWGVVCP